MRRRLLLILILLLPLQLSWAAVASYCQNDSAQTRTHFGHHEHQSGKKSAAGKDHGTKSLADNDTECGLCHLSCCKSVTTYSQLKLPVDFSLAASPLPPSYFSSHIAEGPEKPNWQRAA
jgi:hypothetical protein